MLAIFQDYVLINLAILGGLNLLIIGIIIIHRLAVSFFSEYSIKQKEKLWPRVEVYLKSASGARHLPTLEMRSSERKYFYQILLSYAEYYKLDIHELFDVNGFTRERIEKLWTRQNARLLKELTLLRSPHAQDLLFARLAETHGEEAYRVANSLAAIEMNEINRKRLIKTMLKADVNVERSIELLSGLGLSVENMIELLYEQDSPNGEKVFLRALSRMEGLDQDWIVDDIRPYLFHGREVCMATVAALGACGTGYALDLLRTEYDNNPSWEVRSNIAGVMNHFEPYLAIPVLKHMINDEAWWVQFNAMAALASMGPEGMEGILDIALEADNPSAVDFAYQVLNADSYGRSILRDLRGPEYGRHEPPADLFYRVAEPIPAYERDYAYAEDREEMPFERVKPEPTGSEAQGDAGDAVEREALLEPEAKSICEPEADPDHQPATGAADKEVSDEQHSD